jgi:DNA-binding NtrC family response regulator
MARILVLEDEASMRRILTVLLNKDGHTVLEAATVSNARSLLAEDACDLLLADQRLPDGTGLDLVSHCKTMEPALPVILLTAYASIDLAVAALREGAFDFLTKPFNPDVVRGAVRRAFEHITLVRENSQLKHEVSCLRDNSTLIGNSPAMAQVRDWIARVAPTQATVLITGETGTGKELVAREIHRASPRARKPFLAVNCAAVSEQLLESQLFGHERGAFTGAERTHRGFFESAHEGTLFLDEAGEMSLGLQAKLLRVLADGVVLRVGATEERRTDVRVLVATHRDLGTMVRDGRFRDDLYYRLNVVQIPVPPLRERRADISLLLDHFLEAIAGEMKVTRRYASPRVLEALTRYDYPGNIRELRNLVERAYILGRGTTLDIADFAGALGDAVHSDKETAGIDNLIEKLPESLNLRETLDEVERALIQRALDVAGGVQAEAGRQLQLSRSDMAYKVRKYGLKPDAG